MIRVLKEILSVLGREKDFLKSLNSYYRLRVKSSRVKHQPLPQREEIQDIMQGNTSWHMEQAGYVSRAAGREIWRDMGEGKEGNFRY